MGNAERVARERQLSSSRNDMMLKCQEMKNLIDSRYAEVSKEGKESASQLVYITDTLKNDFAASNISRDKAIEAVEKAAAQALAETNADLQHRVFAAKDEVLIKCNSVHSEICGLKEKIDWEQ